MFADWLFHYDLFILNRHLLSYRNEIIHKSMNRSKHRRFLFLIYDYDRLFEQFVHSGVCVVDAGGWISRYFAKFVLIVIDWNKTCNYYLD